MVSFDAEPRHVLGALLSTSRPVVPVVINGTSSSVHSGIVLCWRESRRVDYFAGTL
jgi:hypothetical protein